MGKTVAASRAEVPNWFHLDIIVATGFDPPGLERLVARSLAKLVGRKRQTHKLGFYGVLGEPVSQAILAAGNGWTVSNYAVDRSADRCAWLGAWIAATSEAVVVFGPADATMEVVLGLCQQLECAVRRV